MTKSPGTKVLHQKAKREREREREEAEVSKERKGKKESRELSQFTYINCLWRRISVFNLLDQIVILKKMEATEQLVCQPVDAFNPLITTSFQVSCILVISHIFHLVLKPLGGPFAQLLVSIHFFLGKSERFFKEIMHIYLRCWMSFVLGWCCGRPHIAVPYKQSWRFFHSGFFCKVISVFFIHLSNAFYVLDWLGNRYSLFKAQHSCCKYQEGVQSWPACLVDLSSGCLARYSESLSNALHFSFLSWQS